MTLFWKAKKTSATIYLKQFSNRKHNSILKMPVFKNSKIKSMSSNKNNSNRAPDLDRSKHNKLKNNNLLNHSRNNHNKVIRKDSNC